MSKNSRNSSSNSSSSSSSTGNVKLSNVVAAILCAFVSLANPAANSASFQTSSANVSMVRPAPNVTSVKPSSSNDSMVRPAQSSLALSPAVNVGQRSKSAKTRTDNDCVDIPSAVAIPSDSPSPILSLTSEALSKTPSHLNDRKSFNRLSSQLLIQRRRHPVPKNWTAISLHPVAEARKSLRVIIGATNPMMGNQISKMRLKPKWMSV